MKLPTLIDCAIVLAVATTFVQPAHAKGSSHPKAGDQAVAPFVPWSEVQRVITWNSERHWQTSDGVILVCPWDAKVDYNKKCADAKNEKVDRWMPLTSYAVAGFELAGFQYFFIGSYGHQQLVTYYRAPKPAETVEPAPKAAPAPVTVNVDTLTIRANRVVVQRKK